jgi:hypothetical protein
MWTPFPGTEVPNAEVSTKAGQLQQPSFEERYRGRPGAENEFGIIELANDELTLDLMPEADSASWHEISLFALTFDGYAYWDSFEECARVANATGRRYHDRRELSQSLTVLRTCLFFEQRRYHHFGQDPEGESMQYIRATVSAIRARVESGALD